MIFFSIVCSCCLLVFVCFVLFRCFLCAGVPKGCVCSSAVSDSSSSSSSSFPCCVSVKEQRQRSIHLVCRSSVLRSSSAMGSTPKEMRDGVSVLEMDAKATVGGGVEDVYGEDRATEEQLVTPWTVSIARCGRWVPSLLLFFSSSAFRFHFFRSGPVFYCFFWISWSFIPYYLSWDPVDFSRKLQRHWCMSTFVVVSCSVVDSFIAVVISLVCVATNRFVLLVFFLSCYLIVLSFDELLVNSSMGFRFCKAQDYNLSVLVL